ncbi:MAG: HYR domain-containing protein [Flavobacteriaceae bacterium]
MGNTTVTWTVTDASGNQSTCTQNVTVTDDEDPTITCPSDITVNANASCMATGVALGTPTTNDNCSVANVTINAPSSFPLGNTIVTWTVTDAAGNSSSCTQNVNVVDATTPTITCPGDQNVTFDSNCEFSLQDYTALATTSDNCDNNITITQSPAPGALIAGTVTVTLTATDDANNSSTCTFDVIPTDNINPTAVCQDITVNLAPNGTVNIAALDLENGSTDNCGIVTRTVTPSSFTCADVGDNTVTYTVYDNAGNSSSCTATVTIVDNTPPTMLCNDFVVVVDAITRVATIQATDVDNGSNDACGLATLTVSPNTFAEQSTVYTTTATLTATDVNGNTNSCTVNITVEPPKNQFTYLTGVIVNPIPDNPRPPSALIEVTACPDDLTVPRDIEFNLQAIGTYNLQASDVNFWEYSTDNGETWTQIAGSAGFLTYTITGITSDTFVRLNITDNSDPSNPIVKTSAEAYVRFLPPDEPPVVVSQSAVDICLGESVTIVAESFFDQPNGQFGEGGEFNYAQPDGWRVNYIDGYFPASGDNGSETTWKETNSNNNATFSGINYDTTDNTKFAIAHGVGNITQLETPVFSTIGMTSAEAILNFNTSYYFCNGGYGTIWLSFDSGNTYTVDLTSLAINQNTNSPLNLTSGNTTGVELIRANGNCNNGQRPTTNPRMVPTTINLGSWVGLSGLRIRFEFFGSTSQCQNVTFPKATGNNCTNNPTYNVASGWAIDAVGFAYAYVEDELEWTDEDGNVIAIGTTATVTPVTPGQREYGVTALINGCRADNDDGTNFINVNTSLAYAGQDYTPLASECGESALLLNAYDNTKTAVQNYNKGAWENNLYVVPNVPAGDTDYAPTGVTGQWSIVSASNSGCGTTATFSSNTDPDAIFTANPGTYTLRWTLQDGSGCYDDVTVVVTSCNTIDFDGVNDYITFRNNYNFNNSFSIESWVKPNSVNGTRAVLSKKDVADNTKGYALNIVGGQVVFNWYNNSGVGSVTSGANMIGTDRWYHLAVTFNGSQYILYVDGIQLGSANGSAPTQTPANIEAILGAIDQAPPNNTPTNYFHGWIDEVRIWNSALSIEHIRQMMNQRIEASGSDVVGAVIPTRINGKDANLDGIEDISLSWNNLDGYYRMNVNCGDLSPYKGVSGRLRNITTSQQKTAPLPYTTRVNGTWTTDNTWTNFPVWDTPNSNGINGTPIDWNIVRTAHNITSGDKDITVLGLLVDSNELSIEDPSTPLNETNDGQMLWVTKYLKVDGKLDLVGESQLIQKRYNTNQFGGSIFDNTSTGYAERDQQGQVNPFNYNYFSSPFAPNNATVNNENTSNTFSIGGVLRDGTTTVTNPINRNIVWTANLTAAGGDPTQVSTRWLYAYNDNAGNTYSEWEYLNTSGSLNIGLGYTMKGSGNATAVQNYVFVGKPNNGTISNNVSPENGGLANDILLGNPYPSAIDANEFIKDNIPLLNPDNSPSQANSNTSESINGTLYFWEHYASNNTHILRDYQGGYATYNLSGGLQATTPPPTEDGVIIVGGSGTVIPKRYIPVAQGFFVTGSPGGGLIKFHNDQRVFSKETGSSSVFFEPNNTVQETEINTNNNGEIKRIRLSFKSPEGAERQLLLAFTPNNEADDSYNYGYDAPNYDDFPSDLSWSINNERYVIQGVGQYDDTKKYPFILEIGNSGEIEISLDELENFDTAIDVYIYDALLETYTKFNNSPFVTTMAVADYTDRFYLAFSNQESLNTNDDNEIDSIRVYYLNDTKEIYINWVNSYDIKEVQLINILGQTVKTYIDLEPINSHEIRIPVKNISEGNYVLKVKNSHGMVTNKKVIIKQ